MVNDDDDDVVVFPAKAPTVIPSWRSQIIWILFWVFYGRFLSYRAWHSWHSCFSTAHLALSQGLLRIRVLVLEQDGRRALDAARAVAMIDHGLATWMSKSTGLTWLEWTLKLILETGLLFFQVYLQEHMYIYIHYIYIYISQQLRAVRQSLSIDGTWVNILHLSFPTFCEALASKCNRTWYTTWACMVVLVLYGMCASWWTHQWQVMIINCS